jgi:hypothetical protein
VSSPIAVPLVDLPGSSTDPGDGPVVVELVEEFFDDASAAPVHRGHRASWYGDALASWLLRAQVAEEAAAELDLREYALPTLLSGDRQQVRAARDLFADDDRIEIIGVRVPLPEQTAAATEQLLAALDFTATTWIELTPGPGWPQVLEVLRADGAENLTLLPDGSPAEATANLVRDLIDADLTFRLGGDDVPVITRIGSRGPRYGMVNVLCAVRAALNGAEVEALTAILAETGNAPLISALRRMSEADAAVTRGFLTGVEVSDLGATVQGWVGLGLMSRE